MALDKWGFLYKVDVEDARLRAWFHQISGSKLGDAVDDKVQEITRDTAGKIAGGAPVETGHLKGTLQPSRSVQQVGKGDWRVLNLTPYGIRQNFEHPGGNRYYMTNPIEGAQATFMTDVYDAVMQVIN